MTQQHRQNHATWECKYHVVFIPKYRKRTIFGVIKKRLGDVFHELARRRESKIEEGHLMPDHVHMLISIPPKYSVAQVIGFMKGKSSIWIAQNVERKARNFTGHKFWARGYFVSTVGRDEEMIEPQNEMHRERKSHQRYEQIVATVVDEHGLTEATDVVTLGSKLQDDLGMDEVDQMEVLFRAEERFSIVLPDNDIGPSSTMGDIVARIAERLGENEGRSSRVEAIQAA